MNYDPEDKYCIDCQQDKDYCPDCYEHSKYKSPDSYELTLLEVKDEIT